MPWVPPRDAAATGQGTRTCTLVRMEEGVPPDPAEPEVATSAGSCPQTGAKLEPEPDTVVESERAPCSKSEVTPTLGAIAHWTLHSGQTDCAWDVPTAPWECQSELQVRRFRLLVAFLLHDRLAKDCDAFLENVDVLQHIALCFCETPSISSPLHEWPECGVRAGAWGMRYMKDSPGVYLVNSSAPIDQAGVVEIVPGSNGWFRSARGTGTENVSRVAFDTGAADMWWGGYSAKVFDSTSGGTQGFSVGKGHRSYSELAKDVADLWHTAPTNTCLAPGKYPVFAGERYLWSIEVEKDLQILICIHNFSSTTSRGRLRLLSNGKAQILNCGKDAYLW